MDKICPYVSLISIIVPCYNEEEVIGETIGRLQNFCRQTTDVEVEMIFVDDGSRDSTRRILCDHAARDPQIRIVGFARNFGHQVAVTAGLDAAGGDAAILIDADLQDPPEIMHQMLAKWREGYDVVYGVRAKRYGETRFKLLTAYGFYRVLNFLSDVNIPVDAGDFRLMSRRVVDALKAMPEHDRFIRGMVSWVGFRQCALPYMRGERFAGQSKYPLGKMLKFSADGIFSFSVKPLRLGMVLGLGSAGLALAGILYAIVMRLFTSNWVQGWTALVIAVLFMGGVQLISIGILGEYIGRIYIESKGRPLYVVQDYVGFGEREPRASRSPMLRR